MKVQMNFRLDGDLTERLKDRALGEGRPATEIVDECLRSYLGKPAPVEAIQPKEVVEVDGGSAGSTVARERMPSHSAGATVDLSDPEEVWRIHER